VGKIKKKRRERRRKSLAKSGPRGGKELKTWAETQKL
jgi:hypothetical protein